MFNHYPTFQLFLALVLSMALTVAVMPGFIKLLRHREIGQQVRADGPEGHLVKQGTPTMGGVVILLMMCLSVFIVHAPDMRLLAVAAATLLTGLLGFVDDAAKVAKERSLGLTPAQKMIGLTVICVIFCLVAVNMLGVSPVVTIPFANIDIDLGIAAFTVGGVYVPWLYVFFVFILMAGLSNAVNLTDGLDGLAGGTVMIAVGVMAAICFSSNMLDLGVFAMAAAGACIGFLWFNCYPASIFMGDTGSLALGAAFAAIAVITKTELFSLIIGGIFVAEALSVIIQVAYFKKTRKRIFLMAPLHHHFEKKGWGETKVVMRFWIITALLAGLGFVAFFATRL
ncbi:MAG: phospho-N-acetylmuramoyl-pentapeptide-transferase [Coriobacteriaceae bacterium]|nr:phospho-N-acetylmuramoyl-pentapeptide-transferase [Coriobacteriaceae bacterium]